MSETEGMEASLRGALLLDPAPQLVGQHGCFIRRKEARNAVVEFPGHVRVRTSGTQWHGASFHQLLLCQSHRKLRMRGDQSATQFISVPLGTSEEDSQLLSERCQLKAL
eukprot:3144126-Rhodomonas_salina.1